MPIPWTWLPALLALAVPAADDPTYEQDVRPILRKHCTVCHNTRKLSQAETSGGLALDSLDAIRKGKAEKPVAVPGKSAESPVYLRLVTEDEEHRMPKDDEPLEAAEIDAVRRWIDAGMPLGMAASPSESKRARRVVRSLDVAVPLELKLDNQAVSARTKVGPLPGVTALAFRPGHRELAVGSSQEVVVWALDQGKPTTILSDLPGLVHAIAFSSDGERLAVGGGLPSRSAMVRVYSAKGDLIATCEGHDDVVSALAFRPDGRQLASASFDGTVRFWDPADGREQAMARGHSDFVYDVVYAPDGKTVLTASKDRSIKRFDAETGKGSRTYSDHDDDVLSLAIKPDGSAFVSAGNQPQLRWWKLDDDKPNKRQTGHGGPVQQLAFSGDGARLISASGDGTARIWDGKTGSVLKTLAGAADWQYAAAISPDGKTAAAGGWDGQARVWDVDSGKLRLVLIQPPPIETAAPAWLAIAPAGAANVSDALRPLVRWKVGDAEVSDGPVTGLFSAERMAKACQGESPGPLK